MGVREKSNWLTGLALFLTLLLTFLSGDSGIAAESFAYAENAHSKIEQDVLEALHHGPFVDVIIELKEQADTREVVHSLEKAYVQTLPMHVKQQLQKQAVVRALQETSTASQQRLINRLERYQREGKVVDYYPYYIINAVYARASKEAIADLARFPEVARIALDEKIELQLSSLDTVSPQSGGLEWNLKRIQVQQVWDKLGIRGEGVVVGIIDTGVHWQHEALKTKWRGYNPSRPDQPDPKGNWFDAVLGKDMPYDLAATPHGTHVLGIVVGEDPAGQYPVGVAPEAKWIAARAFTEEGGQTSWLLNAGEFMLAPDGNPALAPDIVVNAWGGAPQKNDWFRGVVKAWRDAGIVPVFAAGNSPHGAKAGSISNPAHYPESYAVGAVDKHNQLASFSNRGPSVYEDAGVKPEIVAPGVKIISSVPGGYARMDGTSMAAPHVAGVAALLRSADPSLTVDEIETILNMTALPLTDGNYPSSPNHGYGHGLVQAYAAVQHVLNAKGTAAVERIQGTDRYQTSVAVSQYGWDSADVVLITRGDDFADALASVPLAYKYDAPVLLTRRNELPEAVKEEIIRLGAETAIIIGQEGAVSQAVQRELEEIVQSVERIGGKNRYDTAAQIARELASDASTAVVANGKSFADALSVAAYAAREGFPILLTDATRLPDETKTVIDELNIASTIVIGGNQVISEAVYRELGSSQRLSGANRYETNVMVNRYFNPGRDTLFVATGRDFPDALSGAALAARLNSGMLLVDHDLTQAARDYLKENLFTRFIILGGEAAVSRLIARELEYGMSP
ncbi:hypothetical protein GCM10010965_22280 [Caldalkalibacillus thermarum]|uniref:cell wall-binding repeat-containing protein n=1 Tax=Caldalkalibacillus thermarum TaxID=296745 RepID=UPI00166444CB|nr:cell wall-binding repeat-containing protein [Caldalkalibacillus thermarum]GGK28990.1 hypothetical protein GCM10010965_22280 [Caldalkalibacillus thermarum]